MFVRLDLSYYVCNTYTMATRDLPDIYALARGPQAYCAPVWPLGTRLDISALLQGVAQECRHIYQANLEWPCYNI